MKLTLIAIPAVLLVLTGAVLAAGRGETFPPADGPAADAAKILQAAARPEADAGQIKAAVRKSLELLPVESAHYSALNGLLTNESKSAEDMKKVLSGVISELNFQPLNESPMPKGFPGYTPVGMIEVKTYPKHRKAAAPQFMQLFRHISKNKIEMTAPVEMEVKNLDGSRPATNGMAFLYQNMEIGRTGQDGAVMVTDAPEKTVVSIGLRGRMNSKMVKDAEQRLNAWIQRNSDKWKAAGELRMMGYNSPFVPASRSYSEVQIPVEKVE